MFHVAETASCHPSSIFCRDQEYRGKSKKAPLRLPSKSSSITQSPIFSPDATLSKRDTAPKRLNARRSDWPHVKPGGYGPLSSTSRRSRRVWSALDCSARSQHQIPRVCVRISRVLVLGSLRSAVCGLPSAVCRLQSAVCLPRKPIDLRISPHCRSAPP
jgi:hypothetical protein